MSDTGEFKICGIIGAAGDLNAKHEQAMRTLLILDSLRGEDSTGIVCVPKFNNGVKVAKQTGDPFQLFDHKTYDKAMLGTQRAIIGHNRYATTGVISRNNAHPFEHETCVGVHNGTLKTKYLLADPGNYQVDSDNIYHHIDKHGLHDALKYMDGAWALVWWDKEVDSINFLRNKERPLMMCWSKDAKCLFWASESWMLRVALGRHGIEHQEVFEMESDIHYEIMIDRNGIMGKPRMSNAPSTYKPYVAPINLVPNKPATQMTVVPPVKKEEPAPATPKKPEMPDASYLSTKECCIETISVNIDDHGSNYIACFDPNKEYVEVRLYAKPRDPIWKLVGCEIVANISGHGCTGGGRMYYKVSPHDFHIIVPAETEEEPEETVASHTGRLITESEFRKTYSGCDWCSQPLDFGARNRFTTGGQCICEDCVRVPAVLEAVNLI